MTRRHRWSALTAYVLAITAAGFLLGPALAVNGGVRAIVAAPPAFWVVLAFLVVSQVRPIDLPRRGDVEEITTSTTFALGLLLAWGTAPAALALASASIVAGLLERKALRKIAFNAAQYILALAAAGGLFTLLGGRLPFTIAQLSAFGASAVVFFLLNRLLVGADGNRAAAEAAAAAARVVAAEQARLAQAEQAVARQLQESARLKKKLLATVSHE